MTINSEDLVYGILLARTYEHCSRTVTIGTPPNDRGLGLVEFFLGTPPFQVLARGPERPRIVRTWKIVYTCEIQYINYDTTSLS